MAMLVFQGQQFPAMGYFCGSLSPAKKKNSIIAVFPARAPTKGLNRWRVRLPRTEPLVPA